MKLFLYLIPFLSLITLGIYFDYKSGKVFMKKLFVFKVETKNYSYTFDYEYENEANSQKSLIEKGHGFLGRAYKKGEVNKMEVFKNLKK